MGNIQAVWTTDTWRLGILVVVNLLTELTATHELECDLPVSLEIVGGAPIGFCLLHSLYPLWLKQIKNKINKNPY